MFKVFLDKFKRFMCVLMAAFMLMSDISGAALQTVHAAPVVVPAGVALVELLKSLLISAGVTYLGYQSVSSIADTDLYDSLELVIVTDPVIAEALEEARRWEETDGSSALAPGYSYSGSGFRVIGGGSPGDDDDKGVGATLSKMVSITLNAELIRRARDVAKAWAESDENRFENAYVDESIPSKIIGTYTWNIEYQACSIASFDSIEDIDVYFGSTGVADFIKSKGYDDSNAAVFCYPVLSGFEFVIVPFGYSYVYNYVDNYLILSDTFDDLINKYAAYKNNMDCERYIGSNSIDSEGYLYKYSYDSGISPVSSITIVNKSWGRGFVSFNHANAVDSGTFLRSVFFSGAFFIDFVDFTFDVSGQRLVYDESKAKPIPDDLTFDIPEDVALSGFTASGLAALIEYVNSLTDQLKDSADNQEEMIEQSKSILEALNNIRGVIHTSSEDVGKIAASVLTIPNLIKQLLGVVPTFTQIDSLVSGIPAQIAAEIAAVFPGADTLADNVASLPADLADALEGVTITVPDIVIPEIAVPDVAVTLDPIFDITVDNNFDGLADEIALAIQGVLEDLFVPDYALTLQKFNAIRGYFGFADNIKVLIDTLFKKLWGITPTPYLKIPLGSETSKYNYGFGSYWIIDISWYANYKSYGDKIILAVVWSFFIWHLFLKLPGVISGAEGQMMSGIHSQQKYNNSKSSKK